MGISHGSAPGVTVIGDNVASAAPSATGSADLVSAGTNTGGVIITSVSMSLKAISTSANATVALKVDSVEILKLSQSAPGSGLQTQALGGFCAIEIPAGEAVGYDMVVSAGNNEAIIIITWRHK